MSINYPLIIVCTGSCSMFMKHFIWDTGKTGHLKRQGQFCTEYPHKRQAGRELDGAICAPAGSDDGTSMDIEI